MTPPDADYFVPLARFILGDPGATNRQREKALDVLAKYRGSEQ